MIHAVADTHALVWAIYQSPELSAAARAVFEAGGDRQIAVSSISFAEIVYLEEKRRLAEGTLARLKAAMLGPNPILVEVPVNVLIIDAMAATPRAEVSDLPDRLIAATALHLDVPLVTRDRMLRASRVKTTW